MALVLTEETIKPYLENIRNWDLKVPDWFWNLSPAEIAACYNGVGSDLTPKYIRYGLTFVYDFAIEAVIVHDVIFSMVERFHLTIDDFHEANKELKINARICLKSENTYSWSYYCWCWAKAWIAEKACNHYGLESWIDSGICI